MFCRRRRVFDEVGDQRVLDAEDRVVREVLVTGGEHVGDQARVPGCGDHEVDVRRSHRAAAACAQQLADRAVVRDRIGDRFAPPRTRSRRRHRSSGGRGSAGRRGPSGRRRSPPRRPARSPPALRRSARPRCRGRALSPGTAVRAHRSRCRRRAATSGDPSTKNGPNTVDSVAPGGFGLPSPTVSIDSPSTSASSTNSCRVSVEICPVRVRKSIAVKYSSSVRFTSRANACR